MPTASLVFFYFGESSYMNRLAQETVPLKKALQGYQHSVLLYHDTSVGPFSLSAADAQFASVRDIPTKANLVKYLNILGTAGYKVDLYIFSHGWRGTFRVSKGTYGSNELVSASYLRSNVTTRPLRAVWQCNCYGSSMNLTWQQLGAVVTSGSRFVNFYPTRFGGFIDAWKGGATFEAAVVGSNTALTRTASQLYIVSDSIAKRAQWGRCSFGQTVLGRSACAEKYFRRYWLPNDWQEGKSGAENMNYSSFLVLAGDRRLRW